MKICIWSLGEFLVRVRAPHKPRSREICPPATNSPTTEAASSCQLQGGFVPPGLWSSSSCCSQGRPAAQPGSSAGRARQLPAPQHPSVHWKPVTPRLCRASLGGFLFGFVWFVFFFPQTLTFKFGFITEFTYIEKKKNRSSVECLFKTKTSNQNKPNGSFKTNFTYLLSSSKEIRKHPWNDGNQIGGLIHKHQTRLSTRSEDKHSQFHFKMPHHISYHTAEVCSELDWKYFFIFKKKKSSQGNSFLTQSCLLHSPQSITARNTLFSPYKSSINIKKVQYTHSPPSLLLHPSIFNTLPHPTCPLGEQSGQ